MRTLGLIPIFTNPICSINAKRLIAAIEEIDDHQVQEHKLPGIQVNSNRNYILTFRSILGYVFVTFYYNTISLLIQLHE